MSSRSYPNHAKDCVCSGCWHSNSEQITRNETLDEAALACDANPSWTSKDLAVYLRTLKWDFERDGR